MYYLVIENSLRVQQILETNDICYEVTAANELFTNYELETVFLLDDFGINTHVTTWDEIINTEPGFK
jgi:hypothetical protein